MELLEGETLASRLRKGPLAMELVLQYGQQIAGALAEAHSHGIVHRDLKPGNIMITRSGVKVLDFGLAKVRHTAGSTAADSPALTGKHAIVGTLAYMSPEQMEGNECDARSDIFSLGLVLCEMATGQKVFEADNQEALVAALRCCEPVALGELEPPSFAHVVKRCLEREPADRWQAASDVRAELTWAGDRTAITLDPAAPSRTRRMAVVLASLGLIGLSVAAGRWLWGTPESAEWTGVMLGGPEIALDPRPSPDGHLVAFQAMEQGITQVAVMKPETGNWSVLTHSRKAGDINAVSGSRDGASIYYDRQTDVRVGVFRVPVLGGDERLILEDAGLPEVLPDGSLLLNMVNNQAQVQYFRFWADSGRLQDLPVVTTDVSGTIPRPRASPDGKQAALFGRVLGRESEGSRLLLLDLTSGALKPLLPPEKIPATWAFTGDGKSVLAAVAAGGATRVVSIPLTGAFQPRTLFTVTNLPWYLDAGPNGSVYLDLADRPAELERSSIRGERRERISSFGLDAAAVPDLMAVLPDGRTVVVLRQAGHGRLMAVEKGKDPTPLIATAEENAAPMAPVGAHEIAFVIGPAPHSSIAVANTSTGRITQRLSPARVKSNR